MPEDIDISKLARTLENYVNSYVKELSTAYQTKVEKRAGITTKKIAPILENLKSIESKIRKLLVMSKKIDNHVSIMTYMKYLVDKEVYELDANSFLNKLEYYNKALNGLEDPGVKEIDYLKKQIRHSLKKFVRYFRDKEAEYDFYLLIKNNSSEPSKLQNSGNMQSFFSLIGRCQSETKNGLFSKRKEKFDILADVARLYGFWKNNKSYTVETLKEKMDAKDFAKVKDVNGNNIEQKFKEKIEDAYNDIQKEITNDMTKLSARISYWYKKFTGVKQKLNSVDMKNMHSNLNWLINGNDNWDIVKQKINDEKKSILLDQISTFRKSA